jgi:hypothetical protein
MTYAGLARPILMRKNSGAQEVRKKTGAMIGPEIFLTMLAQALLDVQSNVINHE